MENKGIGKRKNSTNAWGLSINIISDQQRAENLRKRLQEEKKLKRLDEDTHNRGYIATKIRKYMEEGMEKTDAVLRVMKEEPEIVKKFEYLEKAGLDLRVIFYNWVSKGHGPKVDRPFSDGEER